MERLAYASGYFYFRFTEAKDWFDRVVRRANVVDLTVHQSPEEFGRLRNVNAAISRTAQAKRVRRPRDTD